MKCLNPFLGFRGGKHPSGKPRYRVANPWRTTDAELYINSAPIADSLFACGKCDGCLAVRAMHWSMRCYHQELMSPGGLFLTLTYDDDNYPGVSLVGDHFRLFVRALKRAFPDASFRYLGCGEYGTRTERPHYHILIWGIPDIPLEFVGKSAKGYAMYSNDHLTSVWSRGFVTIQKYDPSHGGYIATYIQKSWSDFDVHIGANGRRSDERFCFVARDFVRLEKPFLRKSQKTIGRDWYEAYASDLFKGYLTYNGVVCSIPRTYMRWLEADFPAEHERIKARALAMLSDQGYFEGDNSFPRLEGRRRYKAEIGSRRGFKAYA